MGKKQIGKKHTTKPSVDFSSPSKSCNWYGGRMMFILYCDETVLYTRASSIVVHFVRRKIVKFYSCGTCWCRLTSLSNICDARTLTTLIVIYVHHFVFNSCRLILVTIPAKLNSTLSNILITATLLVF